MSSRTSRPAGPTRVSAWRAEPFVTGPPSWRPGLLLRPLACPKLWERGPVPLTVHRSQLNDEVRGCDRERTGGRARIQLDREHFRPRRPCRCDRGSSAAFDRPECPGHSAARIRSEQYGTFAKYACCFGENEEDSMWEPLHIERGLSPEASTVTIQMILSDVSLSTAPHRYLKRSWRRSPTRCPTAA
jgi:hypothetical protein